MPPVPNHILPGLLAQVVVTGGSSSLADTNDEFSLALTFSASNGGSFNLDPYGTPRLVFNVASQGYDGNGNQTMVNRTVYGMRVSRRSSPNEAQLDVTDNGNGTLTARIVLSEYIHTGDVITLTTLAGWYTGMAAESNRPVVNDLVVPYFTPFGCWLRHDREIIDSATYRPKLTLGHSYARNGRAVAAVRFFITDQSANTVTLLVNNANVDAFSASGLSAEYFGNDMSLASLAQGQLCTVDAEILPWVGTPFRLSVNGDAYPSPNLSVLQFLNNRTGAYGTAFAYVSTTGGAGVVSTNPATAQASPYSTVAAAAAAIQTFNNTNFSRNNASGGVIRLEVGAYPIGTFSTVAVGEVPLVIEAVNPANRSTTILSYAISGNNNAPDRLKLRNIRLRKDATGSLVAFDQSASLATLANFTFVTENCEFDQNGWGSGGGATFWRTGVTWSINDVGNLSQYQSFGAGCKMCNVVGSTGTGLVASSVYNFVGYKDVASTFAWSLINASATQLQSRGGFMGYSFVGRNNGSGTSISSDGVNAGNRGFMLWGSIVEHCNNATTSPAVRLYGDSDITPVSNVNIRASNILGGRLNFLYNDISSTNTKKYGSIFGSIINENNTKADLFTHPVDGVNGNRVGAWGAVNHVGFGYNAFLRGGSSTDVFANGSWLGETRAIGEVTGTDAVPLVTGFANDQSGAGAGNGDYHITGVSQIPRVPAALMPISTNLFGEAKLLNGQDYAGAV